MKKIVMVLMIALLVSPVAFIRAEEGPGSGPRGEDNSLRRGDDNRGSMFGIIRQAKRMAQFRFDLAIKRFNRIIERIESRADKLADAGNNMSAVNALVETAKDKIAEAQGYVNEIKEIGEDADTAGDLTPEQKAEIKELFGKAKQALKDAKQALHDAIKLMKEMRDNDDDDSDDSDDDSDDDNN